MFAGRDSQLLGRSRLKGLREATAEAGSEMNQQRERFIRLADPAAAPQVFSSFNLFPTPPEVAVQVIELARIQPGMTVLEPSAGMGALAKPARDAGGLVECVEIDLQMANYLIDQGFAVDCADFLTFEIGQRFDRVVMNPPFKLGVDIKHIRRALQHLKPGGRLVSVCAAGEKRRKAFADATHWIDLPEGSFKSEGTNVATAIVVFDR